MALAELQIACETFSRQTEGVEMLKLKGVDYLSFKTKETLSEKDLMILSRLSFFFAIFKTQMVEGNIFLEPVERIEFEHIDSKISNLLKYQGKTNEIFTRMMINVASMASGFFPGDRLQLLDPVAGKATTLYEGMVYGYDVFGVEVDAKPVHESTVFIKRFLQNEKCKYLFQQRQIAGKDKSEAIYIQQVEWEKNKTLFKEEKNRKLWGMVQGDTRNSHRYFLKNSFHLIVGDLPYGIAHGNSTHKNQKSVTRNPFEMLEQAVPAWYLLLKKGGAMCLAWNTFVLPKEKLIQLLEQSGLRVMVSKPFQSFEHLVDQSIKRDIVVAIKD
jgi:tRNA G10  N-methylase Trm11